MSKALDKKGGYAQYVYWYFSKHCMSVQDDAFEQKLLSKFESMGFDAKRLGMTEERKPNMMQDAFQISQELTRKLETQDDIKICEITEVLKIAENTNVFFGRINNEKVVAKQFLHNNAQQTVKNLKQELDFISEKMGNGNLRVNKCLYAFPDEGIAVLSYAEGRRLGDVIETSSPSERKQLIKKSGNWLKKYTRSRRREANFGSMYWYQLLEDMSPDHVSESDKKLCELFLKNLQQRASAIRGHSVIQAATHGDFVGINAHFSDGVICGVDIQGEVWLPIAKDVARFLVWLRIKNTTSFGRVHYGISYNDWAAMLSSQVLDENEYDTILAFFIGRELYCRFLDDYKFSDVQKNARSAMKNYLTCEINEK